MTKQNDNFAFDPENVDGGPQAKAPKGTQTGLNSGEQAPEFETKRNASRTVPPDGVRLMPGGASLPPGAQELPNEALREMREPGAKTVIAAQEAPTTAPASAPATIKEAEKAVESKLGSK